MMGYDKVTQAFSKYFHSDQIDELVQAKADVNYVEKQLGTKASNLDLERCIMTLGQLHARLKQLSIVQVEVAKSLVPGLKSASTHYNFETA